MKYIIIPILFVLTLSACNPFAPGLDNSPDSMSSILGDRKNIDGVFKNLQYAYTFHDTTIYGQLFSGEFMFLYRDYDLGADVSWGRDEEMRTTSGLFQTAQRLDLVWNNIVSLTTDSSDTYVSVSRNFNLTVTFNPSDVIRVDGYADFTMQRKHVQDPWMIVLWRDESNF